MARPWMVAAVAVLVLSSTDCGASRRRTSRDPVARKLAEGDAHFALRADPAELELAIGAYLEVLGDHPEHPEALQRLSRAWIARADSDPANETSSFRTAREFGVRCLMVRPGFAGPANAAGGAITGQALKALEPDAVPCLTTTALAWARWLEARGVAGAAIDLETVEDLAARAVELDGSWDGGMPHAALGLALALVPATMAPDPNRARSELLWAVRETPGRLTPVVDLAVHVYAATGDEQHWRGSLEQASSASLGGDDPDLLENRRAGDRARAALEAGWREPRPWH